jgi:ABC-2 type transport system ATP-binding protein
VKSVTAENLVKTYDKGKVRALDGLSLDVEEGTVLSVLGPNGAGKTTVVRILTTLLRADSGSASVAGIDVIKNPEKVREVIGLSGQYAAVDEILTGYDNLVMFGELYHLGKKNAVLRANELLERFSLTDAARRPIKTYSGGMRRRLDLAASLIVKPKVLLLDEPFGALDDMTRQRLNLELLRIWTEKPATTLMVTHGISEAIFLSDQVAVMSARPGRIQEIIEVDLPRPRNIELMRSPEFHSLVDQASELLFGAHGELAADD